MPARPSPEAVRALARDAACRDADPKLFDAVTPRAARPALAYCARCPTVDLCRRVIRPRTSYYDGVAAGNVWRNGRVVPEFSVVPTTR